MDSGDGGDGGQWTVDSGQWTADSGQWAADSGQWGQWGRWTVDGGQWTVDGGQWTVDSGRWTVDSGQWTAGTRAASLPMRASIRAALIDSQPDTHACSAAAESRRSGAGLRNRRPPHGDSHALDAATLPTPARRAGQDRAGQGRQGRAAGVRSSGSLSAAGTRASLVHRAAGACPQLFPSGQRGCT